MWFTGCFELRFYVDGKLILLDMNWILITWGFVNLIIAFMRDGK